MTREEAIKRLEANRGAFVFKETNEALDLAIEALSAEPIERISDNTIVVKYADYEDIGRIILTNGDIFCKMFYEDDRQKDDSDYDSLVPDEYKTEPSDLMSHEEAWNTIESDLISRADAIESMANAIWHYPNELYADLNDYNMAEALAKDGLMSVTSQNLTKPNKTCEVDLINRADAIEVISKHSDLLFAWWKMICRELKDLPSADAEPKWNCTANFVAEQLDRLRNMTDEERWEFFKRFFEMKGGDSE